jgi:hypothetical protein
MLFAALAAKVKKTNERTKSNKEHHISGAKRRE